MKCYLTCSNRHTEKSMKYQLMVFTAPDNIIKPLKLNERFQ
ncbi:hypothetical protein [Candidatus Enterovibrio altilux]|nr:hypothetical protein [Candidatus Enterovibrio luxaltus]